MNSSSNESMKQFAFFFGYVLSLKSSLSSAAVWMEVLGPSGRDYIAEWSPCKELMFTARDWVTSHRTWLVTTSLGCYKTVSSHLLSSTQVAHHSHNWAMNCHQQDETQHGAVTIQVHQGLKFSAAKSRANINFFFLPTYPVSGVLFWQLKIDLRNNQ